MLCKITQFSDVHRTESAVWYIISRVYFIKVLIVECHYVKFYEMLIDN